VINEDIDDNIVAGSPVPGHAQPSLCYRLHATPRLGPAASVDHEHGPGPQSVGDTSQLPTVQADMQSALSPTVDSATASSGVSESEAAPATEVPVSPSAAAAEHSDLLLANIKEKTPMCLINELARFNKVHFSISFGY